MYPVLTTLYALLATLPVHAAQITAFAHGGTGCPQGTVSAVLAPDGSALTVLYSNFVANVNSAQRQDAKDCTVSLKIAKPVLQALVLDSADFRGFVGLEAGVEAQQQVEVQSGYGRFVLNQQFGFNAWQGPVSQSYLLQSVKPVVVQGNLVDCANQIRKDTKIEIKTKVRAQSRSGGQGLYTVDSVDGRMQQSYRFKLVNCLGEIPFPFGR